MRAASVVLVMNMLWLGAGFVCFCFRSTTASYFLVGPADATERGRRGVAGAIVFLGGLNLALLCLSLLTFLRLDDFPPSLLGVPVFALMVGHGSQWLVNLPVAIAELRGRDTPWRVFRRPMRMIFVLDGVLTAANALLLVKLL
jgi:hypothetical protein